MKHNAFALFAAALLLLLTAPAWAATVNLSCPGGPSGPQPTIGFAVATLAGKTGCTITVTGTTVEPTVNIYNIQGLTIEAPAPGPATFVLAAPDNDAFDIANSRDIVLRRLTINGPPASNGGVGVYASSQSLVTLDSCTVSGWVDMGVLLDSNSSAAIRGSALQNNGDGVDVTVGSTAVIQNSTFQNNAYEGVLVFDRSGVTISGTTSIAGNGDAGLWVQDLSRAQINGHVTIQNNFTGGIVAVGQSIVRMSGPGKVSGNGCPDTQLCYGGVYVIRNSTFRAAGSTGGSLEISGNVGSGLYGEQGADIAAGDTKFLNNTGDGMRVVRLSNGSLIQGNTFSGNGGASFSCDTTSLVSGDVSGITNFNCKQVERLHGPPRPGKFKGPNP